LKSAGLWPSLASIRREFYPELAAKPLPQATNTGFSRPSKSALREVMGPLQDLAERRANLAARKFSGEWASGRLVPIKVLASVRPVLLDQLIGPDQWRAFMVAPECDWATYSDVLLEPEDEPFDPLCGMVQTWNSVVIRRQQRAGDGVLGELSALRLSAIREAAIEASAHTACDIEATPGAIALRSTPIGSLVLTGSPLGHSESDDPRLNFKALYARLAQEISG
jgi:hypothetical protein